MPGTSPSAPDPTATPSVVPHQRPHKARAAITVVVACLALCASAAPAGASVAIPSGRETAVMGLVAPFVDEGEVVPGVRLSSVQIGASSVTMTVQSRDGSAGDVVLTPVQGDRLPGQPAFAVQILPSTDPQVRAAQQALVDALRRNDRGEFAFAQAAGVVGDGDESSDDELGSTQGALRGLERWVAVACWLGLLLLAGLWIVASVRARPQRLQPLAVVAWVGLFVLATWARWRLGFDPLHANDHAWEDAAVAMRLPGEAAAEGRLNVIYGPALRMAQQTILPVFGRSFEGLAHVGAVVGAAATVLVAMAVRPMAGGVATVLIAVAMATAPLAVRVAASESDMVFAQLALAWIAAVAVTPRRVPTGPAVAIGCGLLALGHVVGPAWAAGAAGIAVASRHARRLAQPSLPVERHLLLGPAGWSVATREALGLALWAGGAAAGLGVLRLVNAAAMVQTRAFEESAGISISTDLLLVTYADFVPTAMYVLVLVGIAGDLGLRIVASGRRAAAWATALLGSVALWLGVFATVLASVLVIACISDGLRYQSVAVVAALIIAGRGAEVVRSLVLPRRSAWGWLLWVVVVVAALDVVRPRAGLEFVDAQMAGWRALQRSQPAQEATLTFVMARRDAASGAIPDVPRGRWSAAGPSSVRMRLEVAEAVCAGGHSLPASTLLYRPPSCAAIVTGDPPCAALARLDRAGPEVAAGTVDIAQIWDHEWPEAEFLRYPSGSVGWSLRRAACPVQ